MAPLLSHIESIVNSPGILGALGFFIGAFIEEVLAPIPLPLLLIGASYFFGKPFTIGFLSVAFFKVILPISLGATAGSLVIFGLAYWGGKGLIDKFHKWFGFSWNDVEKLRERLSHRKSDEVILFLSRCLPFTPTTIITVLAGVVRMNLLTYTILTWSGILVRVTALFAGAMVFGQAIYK